MGERFYTAQKEPRKRVLKKDYITDIQELLSFEVQGLEKCTIATLDVLERAIKKTLSDNGQ